MLPEIPTGPRLAGGCWSSGACGPAATPGDGAPQPTTPRPFAREKSTDPYPNRRSIPTSDPYRNRRTIPTSGPSILRTSSGHPGHPVSSGGSVPFIQSSGHHAGVILAIQVVSGHPGGRGPGRGGIRGRAARARGRAGAAGGSGRPGPGPPGATQPARRTHARLNTKKHWSSQLWLDQ